MIKSPFFSHINIEQTIDTHKRKYNVKLDGIASRAAHRLFLSRKMYILLSNVYKIFDEEFGSAFALREYKDNLLDKVQHLELKIYFFMVFKIATTANLCRTTISEMWEQKTLNLQQNTKSQTF